MLKELKTWAKVTIILLLLMGLILLVLFIMFLVEGKIFNLNNPSEKPGRDFFTNVERPVLKSTGDIALRIVPLLTEKEKQMIKDKLNEVSVTENQISINQQLNIQDCITVQVTRANGNVEPLVSSC